MRDKKAMGRATVSVITPLPIDQLGRQIDREATKPTPEESVIERRVAELSALTEIKYAVARASAAKELRIPRWCPRQARQS